MAQLQLKFVHLLLLLLLDASSAEECLVEFEEDLPVGTTLTQNVLQCLHMSMATFQGSILGQQLINSGAQYLSNNYFSFSSTGAILIAQLIDRDSLCTNDQIVCRLKYSVIVYDAKNDETRSLTLQLRIRDKNDNVPRFDITSKTLHVVENAAPMRLIMLPAAHDGDALEKLTYRLSPMSNSFEIRDMKLGAGIQPTLILRKTFDFENKSEYHLTLTACDTANQCSLPLKLFIKVEDQNDNAPVFLAPRDTLTKPIHATLDQSESALPPPKFIKLPNRSNKYVVTVRENETGLFFVIRVQDADSEMNSRSILSLDNPTRLIKEHFVLNTVRSQDGISEGELVIRRQLNPNSNFSPYRFNIRATDSGVPPMESVAEIEVNVLDINNHKPEIFCKSYSQKTQLELMENQPNGNVAIISVIDKDLGENSRVRCQMGLNYQSGDFQISELSPVLYQLTNDKMYDCEKLSSVKLEIICRDFGSPSLNSTLIQTLPIGDVNEFPPVFNKKFFTASINEDGSDYLSQYVLHVKATDKDCSKQLVYKIINDVDNYFRMEPDSGAIYTARSIDREQLHSSTSDDHIEFDVRVSDGQFNDMASVRVKINDINDNKPEFVNSSPFRVKENEPINTVVGQIQAHDSDQMDQLNLRISFAFVPDCSTQFNTISGLPFDIRSNGQIVLIKELDRERITKYVFCVKAMDGEHGSLRHTTTGTVTIIVEDVNDNKPYFRRPERKGMSMILYDSLPVGSLVYKVEAYDVDTSDMHLLTYRLVPMRSNFFRINETTGDIFVANKLTPGRIFVPIRASDSRFNIDTNIYFNVSSDESNVHIARSQELEFNFTLIIAMVAVTTGICVTLVVAIVLVRRNQRSRCSWFCTRRQWNQRGGHNRKSCTSVNLDAVYTAADTCINGNSIGPLTTFGQSMGGSRCSSPSSHQHHKQLENNFQKPLNCYGVHLNPYDLEVASADSGHGASEEDALSEFKGNNGAVDNRLHTLPHLHRGKANCNWSTHVHPPLYHTLGRGSARPLCNCDTSCTTVDSQNESFKQFDLKPVNTSTVHSHADHRCGVGNLSLTRSQFNTTRLSVVPDISSPSHSSSRENTPIHFGYGSTVNG